MALWRLIIYIYIVLLFASLFNAAKHSLGLTTGHIETLEENNPVSEEINVKDISAPFLTEKSSEPDHELIKLEADISPDYVLKAAENDFVLPGSRRKFSQLPHCADSTANDKK